MPPDLSLPAHVLITTDAVGGVWRHAVDLAAGLSGAGIRVTLVTLGPPPADDQAREVSALDGVRLQVTALPLDWTARGPGEIAMAGRRIAGLAKRAGADLVHLHTAALAEPGAFDRPVVATHHSCVATWWEAVRGGPMPADFGWRTEAVRRGLAAADVVVAPTAAFAKAVGRRYGLARSPAVVPNGTPPRAAVDRPRRRRALTVGRLWDDAKGAAVLDAAAGLLDAPVRAAGPLAGPGGACFAPTNLEPLGRLDREALDHELACAGAFVSLARYEPFGLAVLEAAAAGCPLVLADIPTFRELWDGAARFVDPRDPEAVAAALARVLDDDVEAARLGRLARRRAAAFPPEAVVAGYTDLYRHALAAAPIGVPA